MGRTRSANASLDGTEEQYEYEPRERGPELVHRSRHGRQQEDSVASSYTSGREDARTNASLDGEKDQHDQERKEPARSEPGLVHRSRHGNDSVASFADESETVLPPTRLEREQLKSARNRNRGPSRPEAGPRLEFLKKPKHKGRRQNKPGAEFVNSNIQSAAVPPGLQLSEDRIQHKIRHQGNSMRSTSTGDSEPKAKRSHRRGLRSSNSLGRGNSTRAEETKEEIFYDESEPRKRRSNRRSNRQNTSRPSVHSHTSTDESLMNVVRMRASGGDSDDGDNIKADDQEESEHEIHPSTAPTGRPPPSHHEPASMPGAWNARPSSSSSHSSREERRDSRGTLNWDNEPEANPTTDDTDLVPMVEAELVDNDSSHHSRQRERSRELVFVAERMEEREKEQEPLVETSPFIPNTKQGSRCCLSFFVIAALVFLAAIATVGGICGAGLCNKSKNTSTFIQSIQFYGIPFPVTSTTLDLSKQGLVGPIPIAQLQQMTNLQELNLAGNSFTGTIPPQLAQLPLTSMDLSSNALIGAMPPQMASMGLLQTLDLSGNRLSGRIDTIFQRQWRRLQVTNIFVHDGVLALQNATMAPLSSLQALLLHDNLFSGTVPSRLAKLTNLTELTLYNNPLLTGSIPSEVCALPELDYVNIGNARSQELNLTCPGFCCCPGRFESCATSTPSLTPIDSNSLEPTSIEAPSTQPTSSSDTQGPAYSPTVSDPSNPTVADEEQTGKPSGAPTLAPSKSPTKRQPSPNPTVAATTEQPSSSPSVATEASVFGQIFNIADTQKFDLSASGLQGTVPSEIGLLTAMTVLDLSSNQLSGSLPTELFALTLLSNIFLDDNELSSTIPTQFGSSFPILTWLSLQNNQFEGPLPSQLGDSTLLTYLILEENSNLSGMVPDEICTLAQEHQLSFFLLDPAVTCPVDCACESTGQTTNTATPTTAPTSNSAGSLEFFGQTFSIADSTSMDFFQAGISGTIPTEVGKLTRMTSLHLGANQLSGYIPSQIGLLTLLTFLELRWGGAFESGPLPTEFGNLSNLRTLSIGGVDFTGTIPTEIAKMTSLSYIDGERCSFTGRIPDDFYALTSLTRLEMPYNSFSGALSPLVGQFSEKLFRLDLSSSSMTGTLPRELGLFTDLQRLWLQGNQFEGEVPNEVCVLTQDFVLGDFKVDGATCPANCGCEPSA